MRERGTLHTGLLAAVVVMAAFGATSAGAEPDVHAILQAIDAQSNFADTDFAAVFTMTTQDPEKGLERTVVRMFRRDRENKFLLLIQEPDVQRGQGYLQDGESLWFYDPESRRFSHTSLRDAFEGSDARNSDFAQSTLAEDYRVVGYERGTLGQHAVYIMDLEAVRDEVTYPFLRLWVTEEPHLALKVEEFSLTRRLMRTAYYPSYVRVGTALIPRQMLFVDELVEGRRTQIVLSEISVDPLPANVFTKAFVERVNR